MSEPRGRFKVGRKSEIESGGMLRAEVDGLPPLLLYRVGDEFYCTEETCTHGAASLHEEGHLDGYIIECSRHEGSFDIRTGAACALPCTEPLRTFPVTVDGEFVYVDVD